MAIKDIIADLHTRVSEKLETPQKYFHQVSKPIEKAGLDEIEIYRAVAEHAEENEIAPEKLINDLMTLFEELPRNLYFIKTSDRFHYMRKSLNEIKRNQFSDKQFICNSCHYIHPIRNKAGTAKMCKECHKLASKESYERQKQNPKPKVELKPDPEAAHAQSMMSNLQTADKQQPAPVPAPAVEVQPPQVVYMEKPAPEFGEFITMSDLMTEPDNKKVTLLLECDFSELKNLLEIIDPYLIRNTKEGINNDEKGTSEDAD
ncbi:hypothetical protein VCHA31O73_360017 [Vibrio chagasii]|nr:hypothetical protein VCHA31O73_360017 [Vibrio chagasii]